MIDQPTPETDAKLAGDPQRSSDSPDYARALEIHIHLLRAELADERAKKSDALIAAVDDIVRLRAALDLIAAPMRPDGTYNRDRAACGIIAREALNTSAQ